MFLLSLPNQFGTNWRVFLSKPGGSYLERSLEDLHGAKLKEQQPLHMIKHILLINKTF